MITCGHLPEPVLQRILLQNFSTAWRRTAHELDVLASTRISRFRTTPDNHCCRSMRPGSGAMTGECACIQRLIMSYWEPCSVLFVACSKVR